LGPYFATGSGVIAGNKKQWAKQIIVLVLMELTFTWEETDCKRKQEIA
jgi:hypothetical protein